MKKKIVAHTPDERAELLKELKKIDGPLVDLASFYLQMGENIFDKWEHL